MKRFKGIGIFLLLVVILAVTPLLSGCGKKDKDEEKSTPGTGPSDTYTPPPTYTSSGDSTEEGLSERAKKSRQTAEKYGLPYCETEDEDMITITRVIDGNAQNISPDNPFIKAIEDITNVKVNVEYIVGDVSEKIGVWAMSGDLPDMVNVGVGEQPVLYNAGRYKALQQYVEDYAPNYRNQFAQYWPFMFTADGNKYIMSIWGMPSGVPNPITYNGCAFWIQKRVLEHFGRAPKTLDEYFQFINEFKELNPTTDGKTTIGFETQMFDWRVWSLLHPSKFLMGYGNWGDAGVADLSGPNKDVAIDPYVQDWYKRYFVKLNEEFLKGTIVKETYTRNHDDYVALLASGCVLGMFDQQWSFQSGEESLTTEGKYSYTYIPLALTWDESIRPFYLEKGNFDVGNGFGISANLDDKTTIRIMKLVNYLMQEDVQKFLSWGIVDEHYYVENGRYLRTPEQRKKQEDPQWVRDNMGRWYRDLWPKIDGTFPDGNSTGPGGQNEEVFEGLTDYDKALFKKLGMANRIAFMGEPVECPPYYPFWSKRTFNNDGSVAADLWNTSVHAVKEYTPLLVTAAEGQFETVWNKFQTEYRKQDLTPLYDALNADIQRAINLAKSS